MALALVTSLAPVASASGPHSSSNHPADACYSQLDNDNGNPVISQKYEKPDVLFNNRAADDFTLAAPCIVESLDIDGQYFKGHGPAIQVQLTFSLDNGGVVGSDVAKRTVLEANLTDNQGSFHIPLPRPVALDVGTYWISVQVRQNFGNDGGFWGWDTNNTQRGSAAVWENPGNGLATGCTTYTLMTSCRPPGPGPDLAFAINDAL